MSETQPEQPEQTKTDEETPTQPNPALTDDQKREILTAQGETPERIDEYLSRHQEPVPQQQDVQPKTAKK